MAARRTRTLGTVIALALSISVALSLALRTSHNHNDNFISNRDALELTSSNPSSKCESVATRNSEVAAERPATPASATNSVEGSRPALDASQLNIRGRVISEQSLVPIVGASLRHVTLHKRTKDTSCILEPAHEENTTLSGEGGQFTLKLERRSGPLIVESAGYSPTVIAHDFTLWNPTDELVVALRHSAQLTISVLDRAGVPIGAYEVVASCDASMLVAPTTTVNDDSYLLVGDRIEVTKIANDHGDCVFDSLPANTPLRIVGRHSGSQEYRCFEPSCVIQSSELTRLVWRIGGGCTIRGRVVDSSRAPISGAELWICRSGRDLIRERGRGVFVPSDAQFSVDSAVTNSTGGFCFQDVQPGLWWIGAKAVGTDFPAPVYPPILPIATPILVKEGTTDLELFVVIPPSNFIRGRALDPERRPVSCIVSIRTTDNGMTARCLSRPDSGAFEIGPIEDGEYSIQAIPLPTSDESERWSCSEAALVRAGDEEVQIQLRLGGTVQAQAIWPNGRNDTAADFLIVDELNARHRFASRTRGASDLEVTIPGIPSGYYDVSVVTASGGVGYVRGMRVDEGDQICRVVLPLRDGARIMIQNSIQDIASLSVDAWSGSVCFRAFRIRGGERLLLVVPVGHTVLRWTSLEGESRECAVDASEGVVKEITIGPRK